MNMGEINIREIQTTDYNDVYLLNQELGYLYPIEKVKERISYIIKNTKDIILVAQQNDEVVGYIHGSPYELLYSDSLINILGFVVKEKFRNTGIGNILISHMEYWAKENGYSGIRLVSGFDRSNAHRFYQKHGYINRKDQKNFIKTFDYGQKEIR
jgi:predicted N-acetyltransferase YhbS